MVTTAPKGLALATPEQSGITLLQEKGVVNFQLGSATGVALLLQTSREESRPACSLLGHLADPDLG